MKIVVAVVFDIHHCYGYAQTLGGGTIFSFYGEGCKLHDWVMLSCIENKGRHEAPHAHTADTIFSGKLVALDTEGVQIKQEKESKAKNWPAHLALLFPNGQSLSYQILVPKGYYVSNFLTQFSGLHSYNYGIYGDRSVLDAKVVTLKELIEELKEVCQNAYLLAHDGAADLRMLGFPNTELCPFGIGIYDTMHQLPFVNSGPNPPAFRKLADLTKDFLGQLIQTCGHDPFIDAKCTFKLFLFLLTHGESVTVGHLQPTNCPICWKNMKNIVALKQHTNSFHCCK